MKPSILVWFALGVPLASAPASSQAPAPEAFVERHVTLDLSVDYTAPKLSGAITYELENWTERPANKVSFILHRLMEVSRVQDAAGGAVPYTQDVVRFRDDPIRQVTQVLVNCLPRSPQVGGRPCASGVGSRTKVKAAAKLAQFGRRDALPRRATRAIHRA